MWISVVVALALLLVGIGLIVWLLKTMGESGIEAAAPGSCRSGRCGVTPQHRPGGGCAAPLTATAAEPESGDTPTRQDAGRSTQPL